MAGARNGGIPVASGDEDRREVHGDELGIERRAAGCGGGIRAERAADGPSGPALWEVRLERRGARWRPAVGRSGGWVAAQPLGCCQVALVRWLAPD